MNTTAGGFWIAYYADWSGFAIFDTEVECLRYAVEHHMEVAKVGYGVSVREAVR